MPLFLQVEFKRALAVLRGEAGRDWRRKGVTSTRIVGIKSEVSRAFVSEQQFSSFFGITPKSAGITGVSHVDLAGQHQNTPLLLLSGICFD